MAAALRAQVQSGRCVLLHLGARWSPESRAVLNRIKEKELPNVSLISFDIDDPALRTDPYWKNVDVPSVPSFRVWGQQSQLLETTSWETAVEKCRSIVADPITEATVLLQEGNLDGAQRYFAEALLMGRPNFYRARLGMLRCHVCRALAGEYSPNLESILFDLRTNHESEFKRMTDFEIILQGELIVFRESDTRAEAQRDAIEDYIAGFQAETETERDVLFKRALDTAIEHYHRVTKPAVARDQHNLENSKRQFDAADYSLDRLVGAIWIRNQELGDDALFRIEHDLLTKEQMYRQPWRVEKWTPFKPRMIRKRLGGPPRILRNGKWDWLSPDWVIVNNKKMDSGFA